MALAKEDMVQIQAMIREAIQNTPELKHVNVRERAIYA